MTGEVTRTLNIHERLERVERWLSLPLWQVHGLGLAPVRMPDGSSLEPLVRDLVETTPGRLLEDSLRLPSHVHKVTEPGVLLPLQEAHLAAVGIGEAREAVRAAHEEGLAGYSYPGSFEDGAQRRYAFDPLAVGGDVRPAFEGREWYRMYGADCPTIDPTTALLIGKPMMMQCGSGTGGSPFPLVYRVGPMNEEAATAITEVAAQLLYPDDNFDYPSYHATTFGSKYYELATYIERPSFQEV